MLKIILILGLGFILNGCSTSNPYLSMQPQIYKPDGYSLSVTRPGMATSTDTSRVANTYCDQFDRISSLTKLASPWIVPMKDEFICIEKDAELQWVNCLNSMKYETYDQLISLVADFRLAHHNLTDDELEKQVNQTCRIDHTILREMDGVTDLFSQVESDPQLIEWSFSQHL